MKKCITLSIVLLTVAMLAQTVTAGEAEEDKKARTIQRWAERDRGPAIRREESGRKLVERKESHKRIMRDRSMKGQMENFEKQFEKSRQVHETFIGELVAIKQLALKENAPKTAERIQQLIDKKNKEFDKSTEKFQQRRDQIREHLLKRTGRLQEPNEPATLQRGESEGRLKRKPKND